MRPLDESPKVWKFIRGNDLAFVILWGFFDVFLTFSSISLFGFIVGFSIGLFFFSIVLAYYFLKTIMPTNFLLNYIFYRISPKSYVVGPEPSEIDDEVKKS